MKLARNFGSIRIFTRVYGVNSLLNATLDDSVSSSHVVEIWWIFEGGGSKI